jgi:protein Tex
VYELVQSKSDVSHEIRAEIKTKFELGDQTISDIIEELKKPNRDPRDGYPKPIMQKGVIAFEDLKEGMIVTGKIKNVVDFGAFVDIGIKETALLHLSEMSDHFVKDPMDVVKVGDVKECRIIGLDLDRRRISLSCKNPASSGGGSSQGSVAAPREGAPRRVVVAKKSVGATAVAEGTRPTGSSIVSDAHSPGAKGTFPRDRDGRNGRQDSRGGYSGGQRAGGKPEREDDGMMYNPFAALLKDKKK